MLAAVAAVTLLGLLALFLSDFNSNAGEAGELNYVVQVVAH